MTPTQRKAMEQALEALELTDNDAVYGLYRDERRQINDTITALRAALAEQPAEQEPTSPQFYAHRLYIEDWPANSTSAQVVLTREPTGFCTMPLYTAPQPAKQPLTDEEIWQEYGKLNASTSSIKPIIFARAIEAALGITGETK